MYFIKGFAFLAAVLAIGFFTWRSLTDPKLHRWSDLRFAAVIPLAGVGYLAPNIWMYYGAVTAAMIFLPRSRGEAGCLFLISALMLPLVEHEIRIGSVLLIKMSTLLAAAIGLLAAFRFPGDPARFRQASARCDVLAFAMFLLLVVIDTRIATTSLTTVLRTSLTIGMTFFLPYWFLARLPLNGQDPRRLIHCIAMIAFILALVAIFETVRNWPLYQVMERNLDISSRAKSMNVRAGFLRSPGPFFESTTFGLFLALGTTFLISSRSLFRSKTVYWGAAAICVIGTSATLARNAWLGLIVGLVSITLYRGRSERFFGLTVGGLFALALLSLVASSSERLGAVIGLEGHAASTGDYRENLLSNSIPLIMKSPLFGTPYDRVLEYMRPIMRSSEISVDYVNSYLYFTVATGFIGLVIFVIYTCYTPYRLLMLRPKLKGVPREYEAATAVFAGSGAFLVMIVFTSYYERIPLFGAILIAFARQVELWTRNQAGLAGPKRAATPRTEEKLAGRVVG